MRAYEHACIYGYNIFYILTQSEEKTKTSLEILNQFHPNTTIARV